MGVPRRFPQPWIIFTLLDGKRSESAMGPIRRSAGWTLYPPLSQIWPGNGGWRSDEKAEEPFIRQPLHPFSREWRCAHNREHSGFYSVAPDSPEGGSVNMMENV